MPTGSNGAVLTNTAYHGLTGGQGLYKDTSTITNSAPIGTITNSCAQVPARAWGVGTTGPSSVTVTSILADLQHDGSVTLELVLVGSLRALSGALRERAVLLGPVRGGVCFR